MSRLSRSLKRTPGLMPALAAGALGLSCVAPPLESPPVVITQQTPLRVEQNIKNKVDILFMVDNSNSMEAMSQELRAKFDQFFKVFQDLADKGSFADLHIGVVTSDFGAGASGAPNCQPSPGGQRGRLQALGQAAPNTCKPPVGANYIAYDFANGGKNHNLPGTQNLVQTFTCMASVGSNGCGFEHQLESVYSALHDNLAENKGFLRDDALLTVVFLTNEDDSSAPPDTDMFDKNKSAMYGYESSYRQTRWGVQCDYQGMKNQLTPYGDSGGPMDNCHAASNPPGREYEISRYINFFTKPAGQGGVKVSPLDVILVGIDAPETPVQVILSNPGTSGGMDYIPCPQLNESTNPPCVPVLQHSCKNIAQSAFFGDPAVRLNAVIKSAKNHKISSICDTDYTGALQDLGKLIVSNIGGGCIPAKLPDPSMPECVVTDVTVKDNGVTSESQIKQCGQGDGPMDPCWKVEKKDTCKSSPDGVGITIDRKGQKAPANTTARVFCTTLAGT